MIRRSACLLSVDARATNLLNSIGRSVASHVRQLHRAGDVPDDAHRNSEGLSLHAAPPLVDPGDVGSCTESITEIVGSIVRKIKATRAGPDLMTNPEYVQSVLLDLAYSYLNAPAHQVLQTPELVERIFEFLPAADVVRAEQVNTRFREVIARSSF